MKWNEIDYIHPPIKTPVLVYNENNISGFGFDYTIQMAYMYETTFNEKKLMVENRYENTTEIVDINAVTHWCLLEKPC